MSSSSINWWDNPIGGSQEIDTDMGMSDYIRSQVVPGQVYESAIRCIQAPCPTALGSYWLQVVDITGDYPNMVVRVRDQQGVIKQTDVGTLQGNYTLSNRSMPLPTVPTVPAVPIEPFETVDDVVLRGPDGVPWNQRPDNLIPFLIAAGALFLLLK